MSRGRSRHQASRRRMYSARQRELRERRLHAARDGELVLDELTAIEIDDSDVVEAAALPIAPLRRGANAA